MPFKGLIMCPNLKIFHCGAMELVSEMMMNNFLNPTSSVVAPVVRIRNLCVARKFAFHNSATRSVHPSHAEKQNPIRCRAIQPFIEPSMRHVSIRSPDRTAVRNVESSPLVVLGIPSHHVGCTEHAVLNPLFRTVRPTFPDSFPETPEFVLDCRATVLVRLAAARCSRTRDAHRFGAEQRLAAQRLSARGAAVVPAARDAAVRAPVDELLGQTAGPAGVLDVVAVAAGNEGLGVLD